MARRRKPKVTSPSVDEMLEAAKRHNRNKVEADMRRLEEIFSAMGESAVVATQQMGNAFKDLAPAITTAVDELQAKKMWTTQEKFEGDLAKLDAWAKTTKVKTPGGLTMVRGNAIPSYIPDPDMTRDEKIRGYYEFLKTYPEMRDLTLVAEAHQHQVLKMIMRDHLMGGVELEDVHPLTIATLLYSEHLFKARLDELVGDVERWILKVKPDGFTIGLLRVVMESLARWQKTLMATPVTLETAAEMEELLETLSLILDRKGLNDETELQATVNDSEGVAG